MPLMIIIFTTGQSCHHADVPPPAVPIVFFVAKLGIFPDQVRRMPPKHSLSLIG
jgi:hypothetical protein